MIAKLPDATLKALDKRYGALTLEPRKIKFIDRIVADSRDVAPEPHRRALAAAAGDDEPVLPRRADGQREGATRRRAWRSSTGAPGPCSRGSASRSRPNPLFDAYYGLIDFEFWARKNIGEDAVEYLKKNVHPLDLAFRLAEDHGIVLLNGGGFDAPDWSLRVSLANLADDVYDDIGRGVRAIARGYRDAYEASKRAPKG